MNSPPKTTIGLADDHQMFRDGMESLLKKLGMQVLWSVSDGKEVFRQLAAELVPDVLLVDISMPEMNGLEVLEKMKEGNWAVKVIMLSMHVDRTHIEKALALNADGYLLKNSTKRELKEAIETVLQNTSFYAEKTKEVVMASLRSDQVQRDIKLTPREKEVLVEICNEYTTDEIAKRLFISPNTVETHRTNLMLKTGAKNAVGLTKFAIENGLYTFE